MNDFRHNYLDEIKIMGIINTTPDSFYSGSRCNDEKTLLLATESMLSAGADILDIGGVSTRPGGQAVDYKKERKRIIPAMKAIRKNFKDVIISVDTFNAEIADEACAEGCDIINDISGGYCSDNMFQVVADNKADYILMHSVSNKNGMMQNHKYDNILNDIIKFFDDKIKQLNDLGVANIIIDPGFGFSKTLEENYHLFNNLDIFEKYKLPILVGISRKSMIYKLLDETPQDALNGTTILNTIAAIKGANILRVHDVKEAVEIKKIVAMLH